MPVRIPHQASVEALIDERVQTLVDEKVKAMMDENAKSADSKKVDAVADKPSTRPAISSPAPNVKSLKVAVDALRNAVKAGKLTK